MKVLLLKKYENIVAKEGITSFVVLKSHLLQNKVKKNIFEKIWEISQYEGTCMMYELKTFRQMEKFIIMISVICCRHVYIYMWERIN